nr:reverse transcriptase domain-containing protein [Tanacetum cinerariifolium]
MSTRSSARNLFPPLDNLDLRIRRRSRADPTLLNDFEMAAEGNSDLPSIKADGVVDDALRLYLFPHSLTHHATAWFDRLPRNSINTFEQMAKMFLGKYFSPSMVTKLRNEITNFRQCPNESLFEAWEHYKLLIDRSPNHNMLLVTQIDTFYNGLTLRHCDTIIAAAGGTFMKRPQQSESSSSITSSFDPEIAALKAKMAEINKNIMRVLQVNQQVKAVTPKCETCGGPHSYTDCPATAGQTHNVYVAGAYQELLKPKQESRKPSSSREKPKKKPVLSRSYHGQNPPPAYQAPTYQALGYQAPIHQTPIPQLQVLTTNEFTNYMKANDAILKNMQTNMTSLTNSNVDLKNMFGQFMKMNTASSLGSGTLPGNTITNSNKDLKGITTRSGTAYQGPTIPTTSSSLPQVVECETDVTKDTMHPTNNERTKYVQHLVVHTKTPILNSKPIVAPIIEPARTSLNEHCSAVLLKKLPEKLGDPGKFLILCDFLGMDGCLALADLGRLVGVAEDVFVKVGTFHFSSDFVVVDFDADPRVPLILGRSFLKIERALIDVFEGELTLHVGKEAITLNLDQTSRYSANYNDMTADLINVIDMVCEEYSQEVLGLSDVIASGNPTLYYDPIIFTSSSTLTSSEDSDFLLEEVDAFLALEDDPTSLEVNHSCFDTEGDILLLEAFLNDDPSLPPPNQGNYLPQVRKELKICEAKTDNSSIDEPPEVKLKDLPPHLKYTFLEGDDKLPVIIAKDLSDEEKTALITVLKLYKRAIA